MKTPETKIGRRALLAGFAGLGGAYIASRLLPDIGSVSAASTPTPDIKPASPPRIVTERANFLDSTPLSPSAISLASARKAQTTRTCRELLVYGDPTKSAKESEITAYFYGFPKDQAQGLNFYNSSSQYFDLIAQYLDLVKTFAKREVDMNLAFSVARDPIVMDKPTDKPLLGTSGYGSQGALYDAMLSRLTIPDPIKRLNILLMPLVNTDTELYQVMQPGTDGNPCPGFFTVIYPEYTVSVINSLALQPSFNIGGPNIIGHESLYHGLIRNPKHNDDSDNPNPNLLSIAASRGSRTRLLLDHVLDDWDIPGVCSDVLAPTSTPRPGFPTPGAYRVLLADAPNKSSP